MICLIGGAPRCGKSILAKRLANKKRIPYVSTDSLRSLALGLVPPAQRKKAFPFEGISGSENGTPEESLRAEIVEAKTLWRGLRPFIEQLILCKQDCIIEGVHLMPDLVAEIRGTRFWKNIRFICLVKTDLNEIIGGFPKNKCEHDWIAGCLHNQKMLRHLGDTVRLKSGHIKKIAEKHHIKVFDMSKGFHGTIRQCMKCF